MGDAAVAAAPETGMNCLSYEMQVYSPDDDCYYPSNAVPNGADGKPKKVLKLSGTEVRKRLKTGEDIPEWFSYPQVVDILRQAHPPNHHCQCAVRKVDGSARATRVYFGR